MSDRELLQAIYENMQFMKEDISGLKEDVGILKADVSGLKEEVTDTRRRVTSVELTLENETNKNIRLIAEGHLDLSRKLDDALRVENEKELLLIRVNTLENEMRKMREAVVPV